MKTIALILPYWGRFPNYFIFFLESIRRNPSVDLFLYTDNTDCYDYPDNVCVRHISFPGFKEKMQQVFDFPIKHLENPYNLCDFKPAYGYSLRDDLRGYDFWGHCDCDLVFGDIRSFFTDDLLSRYDRFLSRGHLTIYRNNEQTNRAFMELGPGDKGYRKIYQSSSELVWAWDEWGGTSGFWKDERPDRLYDEVIFDDINLSTGHFQSSQKVRFGMDAGKSNFIFKYDHGKLYRVGLARDKLFDEPTCYAHFQKRNLAVDCKDCDFDKYLIVPNRFIDYEEITAEKLRNWGRKRHIYLPYYERRFKNLLRKIKRVLS